MPAPALSAQGSAVAQRAAPSLGVVRQFADLMNEQQEIERHHQRSPHDAASRRRRVVQLADPRDDLQDEAEAERHMIGPPQRLSQPVIEAMYDAEYFATIRPSRSRQARQFRHFGAKRRKNFVDGQAARPSSWKTRRMARWMVWVVSVDRFGVVSAACRSEFASGREQGFDGFVSQDEERGHRLQTGR
jgi:hypothetical protein